MVGSRSPLRVAFAMLLLALGSPVFVACGSSSDDREAGVIGTGNAGRVMGDVRFADDSSSDVAGARVVLQVRSAGGWNEVDSALSDRTGGYRFESLSAGTYRVVARTSSGHAGASGAFDVGEDGEVRIVVVLVRVTRVILLYVPPSGERVDFIQVEGTGAKGISTAAGWTLELRDGLGDTVRVELASGVKRYAVVWEGGTPSLLPVDEAPPVELVRLLADWTFDETDTLRDRSGQGNVGIRHGGVAYLDGQSAWRFDGKSGYVSLGPCLGWGGSCVDWSDTDLVLQTRVRLDTQTIGVVAHLVTISAGNGEVMVKRIPGDTVAVVMAAPSGWYGCNIPWKARLGQWVDLVFVRDAEAGTGRVYIDGELFRSFEVPHELNKDEGIPPALGAYTSGGPRYFARMDMERMRVWLGKFDAAQVKALHAGL